MFKNWFKKDIEPIDEDAGADFAVTVTAVDEGLVSNSESTERHGSNSAIIEFEDGFLSLANRMF